MSYANPPLHDTVTPEVAAEKMGVTVRWLRVLRKRKKIRAFRYGKLIRFHPKDIEEWLEKKSS